MEEIQIRDNKWKIFCQLLCAIIIFGGGSFFILRDIILYEDTIVDNPTFILRHRTFSFVIAVIGIIFCLLCIIDFIFLLKKNKNHYIINDDGIAINYSAKYGNIFIRWNDIKSITKQKLNILPLISQKYIGIEFKNIDEFISKLPKRQQQDISWLISRGFSPIQINLVGTNFKMDEIINEMNKRIENAKK